MARNVVITGAASGVGKAAVKMFLDLGDVVFMTDWNQKNLDAVEAEFGSRGRV
jgi:NAD(P)-dependent dehydrogenase (short-subunit alcohol dehydrogenase family)